MTPRLRWICAIVSALSFLCGLTDFGRNIDWYAILVVIVFGAFIAGIIIHAGKSSEGS